MLPSLAHAKARLGSLLGRFRRDQRGQIAMMFGLSITALVIGAGAGIDLARAYVARQKLSQVATLTCQYSVKPSVIDIANSTSSTTGGFQTYKTTVNTFATNALSSQNWGATSVTDASGGTAYFTATAATGSTSGSTGTAPTNPVVEMTSNVPTLLMQIVKVTQIPIHAKIGCLTAANAPTGVYPTGPGGSTNYILQEGFETPCSTYCFKAPDGAAGTKSTPSSTTPSSPSYYGSGGQPWYIIGYCLETDATGQINSTSPEGSHTAELDCDNGSGNAGNSSITAKVYLANGSYEMRYNYRSRVDYPNYDPIYICGTTASDVSWANDMGYGSLRTNQINVYLDLATTSQIPLHTTLVGSQQLGGSNLIDVCVYSPVWVERSVKITVTTPGYYWVSFAADGANDSYGGQLDNIRICQGTCTTPLQDNFPAYWLAASNAGVNRMLFEDSFESPTYTQDYPYHYIAKGGNLNSSTGYAPGWPFQAATGWATGPFNQVSYALQGAYQGSQYIALDGFNSSGSYPRNRSVSRPFYLVPGYYQVSYDYISMVDFSPSSIYGTYCTAAPASGAIYTTYSDYNGMIRYYNSKTANLDTNIMGVFMANGQLISTPGLGNAQGSATTYTNTDGTTATYPTTPNASPDTVNYQNYNAAQVNPLLDTCGYASGFTWVPRTVSVKITKPGIYWLTFSASAGTGDASHSGDGDGPGLDDVKLTALGSPYMSSPPTTALTAIPVAAPQPDSTYSGLNGAFNGFTIVADPFMPPSAN